MFSISHFFFFLPPRLTFFLIAEKDSGFARKMLQGITITDAFIFFLSILHNEKQKWANGGDGRGAGGAYTSNYWKKNIHFVLASEKNTQIFLSGSNYSQYWCITTAQFFLFSWNALHSHLMLIHLRSCTHLYDHIALVLVFQWRFRLLFLVSNSACSKGAHEEFFVPVVSLNWRQ